MVVGFDISTTRLDWAWLATWPDTSLPPAPSHRFHILGKPTLDIIERVQNVQNLGLPYDMTEACIEYPFSRYGNVGSLMAVLGALTTRIDRAARTSWISSQDLRAAIGARQNTKVAARARVLELYPSVSTWSEHAIDALVACLGWTAILNLQEHPSA